jgi:hypothetical protein
LENEKFENKGTVAPKRKAVLNKPYAAEVEGTAR